MSAVTYLITADALAPYLWYVHAHTRLAPFYEGDGFGYILKEESALTEEQRKLKSKLVAEEKELPPEFWQLHQDSRWEALPDVAGSDDQVDKQFFRELAVQILNEIPRPKEA